MLPGNLLGSPPVVPRPRPIARRVHLAVAIVLATLGCGREAAPPHPYNVLLISLDTVRRDLLGCYGRRPAHAPTVSPSPVLDRMARDGVQMLDAYAPSSWTLPSHISLLTGEPPLVHGIETEAWALDPATPTLAEILHRHGYRTSGFYSAPYLAPHWGFDRGFDRYQAVYGAELRAASERAAEIRTQVERAAAGHEWARYDDLKWKQTGIEGELNKASERAVTSAELADGVIAELARLAPDPHPWFVFAHFFDAHCDYVPPPPYDRTFDPDYQGTITGTGCIAGPAIASPDPDRPGGLIRAISDRDLEHVVALYEGELAWIDVNVGRILAALDARGLASKTLVVVVSDHGEEFFDHGNLGHRHALYEESVRVPLLLRLPGTLPAGATVAGPVSLTDVLPTVLDVLGLPHQDGPGSASFLPLVLGSADGTRRAVHSRVVTMFEGQVQVGTLAPITLRQVMVQDAFRTGSIKITRTRSWPQFPSTVPAEVQQDLRREAAAQYEREQLAWIDVGRFPGEPDERALSGFTDPTARTALARFQQEYATLVARRHRRHENSPLPENIRRNLESLGYVDAAPGPAFSEPDVVLPPPRSH